MTKYIKDSFLENNKIEICDARAQLIVNITEDILIYMEDHNITKADLARKLGKSRPYISGLFSGERNMTMNTFSDICFAIGLRPEIVLVDSESKAANYSNIRHCFMKHSEGKTKAPWRETIGNVTNLHEFAKTKTTITKFNSAPMDPLYAY